MVREGARGAEVAERGAKWSVQARRAVPPWVERQREEQIARDGAELGAGRLGEASLVVCL